MAYSCKILLGRIAKVSGYEGAVTVRLEKIFSENIPKLESVFLEIDGRPVPFFISSSDYSGADILKLTFKDYNSIEKMREFTGCRVFLTKGVPKNKEVSDIHDLVGYKVITETEKLLGSIIGVIPNQAQWLLSINSPENKEILIPLHEDFIVSINKRKRIIEMELPEGLTVIN